MDNSKKDALFSQYINQYRPVINSTLATLRTNGQRLAIPFAQFLFSVIDYYGLLYSTATTQTFNKKDPQNFRRYFMSTHFPEKDRCKSEFVYFIRNGLIHQIFAKAAGISSSGPDQLLYPGSDGTTPILNVSYLDKIVVSAIDSFEQELSTNAAYVNDLHNLIMVNNYGFNDHAELAGEVAKSFAGDHSKIFSNCI